VVLGERPVRVGDEVLAELDEVLLRRAVAAGADVAAEHDDGEEEADGGELSVPREALDLPHPALPDHPLHPHFPLLRSNNSSQPNPDQTTKYRRGRKRNRGGGGGEQCGARGAWKWRSRRMRRRRRRF